MAKHEKGKDKGKDKRRSKLDAGPGKDHPRTDAPARPVAPHADTSDAGAHRGHAAAAAHGQPATIDTSLPATREELLVRHADARRRRAAAELGSNAYREAADEIGRIEIRIAAVERDQVPPRV